MSINAFNWAYESNWYTWISQPVFAIWYNDGHFVRSKFDGKANEQ